MYIHMQLEVRGVFLRATGNPTDLRHAALRERLSNLSEVVSSVPLLKAAGCDAECCIYYMEGQRSKQIMFYPF